MNGTWHTQPPKRWGDMDIKEFAAAHPYIFWGWISIFLGVTGYNINGMKDKYRKYMKVKGDLKHLDKVLEEMYAKGGRNHHGDRKDGEEKRAGVE
jgi:hypothetical protein